MIIVFIGLVAQKKIPFRIPASLFAIIIGTVLAYALKVADLSQITDGLSHVGFMHNIEYFLAYIVVAITLFAFSFSTTTEKDKSKEFIAD